MTVTEAVYAIDRLAGKIVVIEGNIGHKCDWPAIRRGSYEDTWIVSNSSADQDGVKIKIPPSKAYPRPFRFQEMVHGSRAGGVTPESTEIECVRFCGRLERSDSPAYGAVLHDIRWCEFPLFQPEYTVGKNRIRSPVAEHEFTWRFTVADDAAKPNQGVGLAEFLRERPTISQELVRVSGVIIIESNISPHAMGIHILTPTLTDEHTPPLCARIELKSVPGSLNAILMDVDLEDRMPDFRVFNCILEGSFKPETGLRWAAKFHSLKELIVLPNRRSESARGDVGDNVGRYLYFPNDLLEPATPPVCRGERDEHGDVDK